MATVRDTWATGGETLEAVRGIGRRSWCRACASPAKDRLTVLRELRAEGLPTRVVVFSAALKDELVVEAIHLGARGVVLKEMAPKLLVQGIRKVHAGGEWFETRSVSASWRDPAVQHQDAQGWRTDGARERSSRRRRATYAC